MSDYSGPATPVDGRHSLPWELDLMLYHEHNPDILGGWPQQQPYGLLDYVERVRNSPSHDSTEDALTTKYYVNMVFLLPESLSALVSSLEDLKRDLDEKPERATSVRSLTIHGWPPEPLDGPYIDHIKALDTCLCQILECCKLYKLSQLVIDLSRTGQCHHLPLTLNQILCLQTVRELELRGVRSTIYRPPLYPPSSFQYDPVYERVTLDMTCGDWFSLLVDDPRPIRFLSLHKGDLVPPGEATAKALCRLAKSASNLEILVLSSLPNELFDLENYSRCFEHGFWDSSLAKLRAVSFSLFTTRGALQRLLRGYVWSNITHLRMVVNHNGTWVNNFGPDYVRIIADQVPQLEELVFDQVGMDEPTALPGGDLTAWGSEIRRLEHLRCLAIASFFVLDVHGSYEDHYCDSDETMSDASSCRSCDSPTMPATPPDGSSLAFLSQIAAERDALRESSPSPILLDTSVSSSRPSSRSSSQSHASDFSLNLIQLSVWAENFLDTHLRMESLSELWFLGIHPLTEQDMRQAEMDKVNAISPAGVGYAVIKESEVVEGEVERGEGMCPGCGWPEAPGRNNRCSRCRGFDVSGVGPGSRSGSRGRTTGGRTSFRIKTAWRSGWWWEDGGKSGIV